MNAAATVVGLTPELGGERADGRQRGAGRAIAPASMPRSMLAAISAAPLAGYPILCQLQKAYLYCNRLRRRDGDDEPRTRVTRMPSRADYEREAIEAILDEAIVSHVGTVSPAGHPIVIPTLHARAGEWLYIHGSAASPTLRRAAQAEICLTATLLDGLVLARSAVHHSVNYRSVVVFGQAEQIEDAEGKREALEAFTEKLIPAAGATPGCRPSRS